MEKLYKQDNSGKTREWWAELSADGRAYRLHSGIVGGETVTSEWTEVKTRNAGKANERLPEEQAKSEIESLYKKKLKRGYTEDYGEVEEAKAKLISPMLAHRWEDHQKKITFPLFAQPKLDGIRCIINANGAWSRKGEKIHSIPHIEEILVPICKGSLISFDGELYNHELKDNFNKITSLIRRQKIDENHARDIRKLIQYHIYDLIDADATWSFDMRYDALGELFNEYSLRGTGFIKKVLTKQCDNQDELDFHYGNCLEQGYEGQMIRLDEAYQRKRTHNLLKRKEFQDEEFEIIGMVEGKGNRSGMVGAIIFETASGKQFQASLMGTDEYRRKIWKEHQENSFEGIEATVKYFHLTPDGIPRFPVVKSIDMSK